MSMQNPFKNQEERIDGTEDVPGKKGVEEAEFRDVAGTQDAVRDFLDTATTADYAERIKDIQARIDGLKKKYKGSKTGEYFANLGKFLTAVGDGLGIALTLVAPPLGLPLLIGSLAVQYKSHQYSGEKGREVADAVAHLGKLIEMGRRLTDENLLVGGAVRDEEGVLHPTEEQKEQARREMNRDIVAGKHEGLVDAMVDTDLEKGSREGKK